MLLFTQYKTTWVERFWALCPIFLWPQPVPLMSQPSPIWPQSLHFMSQLAPFAPSHFPHVSVSPIWPQSLHFMSQLAPFAPSHFPHVPTRHICPKSLSLMSWPARSQFPSCPNLLPSPEPLLHCQPVLYPWAKICILSDLMIRLSSLAERAILFTCSVVRQCWRLRMTFIVPSCVFSPLSDFLCERNKGLYEVPSLWSVTLSLLLNEGKKLVSPCAHCLPSSYTKSVHRRLM